MAICNKCKRDNCRVPSISSSLNSVVGCAQVGIETDEQRIEMSSTLVRLIDELAVESKSCDLAEIRYARYIYECVWHKVGDCHPDKDRMIVVIPTNNQSQPVTISSNYNGTPEFYSHWRYADVIPLDLY